MAFCKVCNCGEKIVFERRMSFPDNCPSCGRRIADFQTYGENDPIVAALMEANAKKRDNDTQGQTDSSESFCGSTKYVLKLTNGKEIEIPEEGCVVGRTETGAEELAEFSSVSRRHLRITPKRNVGVLIEDISTYGTLVDGNRIEKNSPVKVTAGSKVTLCNLETILAVKEESDE